MQADTNGENAAAVSEVLTLPVSYVPTPTAEYRIHRKLVRATVEPGAPSAPTDIPAVPVLPGVRALIWKQDPSVAEIGIRKVYLPGNVLPGPRDARIANGVPGIPPVSPNAMGDYITTPGTDAFDAIHTFAVVRATLTMYQRALNGPVPWQWNTGGNTDPLQIFPHGLPNTQNAFYDRGQKALKFGDFIKTGAPPTSPRIFTCR